MFANASLPVAALALAASFLAVQPANAATVYTKFYSGTTGYTGAYSGAGTVYDATRLLAMSCPTVGPCTSDNVATSLSFFVPGPDITATAPGSKVWGDFAPSFGGLGVGSGSPGDTDQIAGNDVLTLTFASPIVLTGVATLFDGGHKPFGTNFATPALVSAAAGTITFLLSVDGGAYQSIKFLDANTNALSLVGTSFSFRNNGTANPDFYVSATASAPVPVPASLPLLATAVGALVGFGRRAKA